MIIRNSSKGYGLVSKMFHWTTLILLITQIPFGFYLVGLEFSDQRINLENIHILIGISIFYVVLIRLIWKVFNPKPKHWREYFKGQTLIAEINHYLLYISVFSITISGVLKKLYMGERLNFFIFQYAFKKSNFQTSLKLNFQTIYVSNNSPILKNMKVQKMINIHFFDFLMY